MSIQEITISADSKGQKKYEKEVFQHPFGTIHQLPAWGEFQVKSKARSRQWIFAAYNEKGEIEASALVLKQNLPLGMSWLYVPRGPLMELAKTDATHELFATIRELGKKEKAVFARFDPPVTKEEATSWERFFGDMKAKDAHAHYQPEATLVVDISQSEDDILKQMKPKGRYNIRVAERHGVKVRVSDGSQKDIAAFYGLLKATTERDKFHGHPQKYYEEMLKTLGSEQAKLYLAEYTPEEKEEETKKSSPHISSSPHSRLVAAAIVTYFADTATYYFGASSNENRNVMAPYLLHWQAMKDAKNAGYKTYDFFGIAPEESRNHPWQSVTEFKLKFGGKRVEYMEAKEIVYKPFWYWLIRIAKTVKEKLRLS